MNIILVIIDTLRYDYIAAHGKIGDPYGRPIQTPNMDRLAERSWVFDASYSCSYPTIPHRTDVITGRYGRPFHRWQPLPFDVATLPRALSEAGYCTQLIHDTPHLVNGGHAFDYPFHAWTFVHGAEVDRPWIDAYDEWPENWAREPLFDFVPEEMLDNRTLITYARANRKRKAPEEWNAAKLFLTASEWLTDNATRDNFFLWVDSFDPHEPWDAPPEFMQMYDRREGYDGCIDPRGFVGRNLPDLPDEARQNVAARYAAKVTLVDRWFGEMLDTLEDTGLMDRTALLLTADHGTNVGERGHFGKSFPVREPEGHTPFILYVPGGGSGSCQAIVQPQDIMATLLGLAGAPVPEGIESYDMLAVACGERQAGRDYAVSGSAATHWQQQPEGVLFTVFDHEWALEYTARAEDCRLTRLGSLEDVAAEHPDVVERMRAAGRQEVERRGTVAPLMEWLRSEGELPFPEDCRLWDFYPGPAGWEVYFQNLYLGK